MRNVDKVKRRIGLSLDNGITEFLAMRSYDEKREHPTPEQVIIREAIRRLTPKQRLIWEYYTYDQLTQDEIAVKLKISQPVVAKHIKACERSVIKYCKTNMTAYHLIRSEIG